MLVPDETLEIIADKFQLNGEETVLFVEQTRAAQIEIILKSFLVYYETHRGRLELEYLEKIADGLDHSPHKYILKFRNLFASEVENDKELLVFLQKRMVMFVSTMLGAFAIDQDRDTVREVVESMFEGIDLAQTVQNNQLQ